MLAVMFDAGYQKGELMITRDDFEVKTDVTGKSTIVIGNIDNVILK